MITNEPDNFSNTSVDDVCLSDHYLISSTFDQPEKIPSKFKTIQYRDIKSMSNDDFINTMISEFESQDIYNCSYKTGRLLRCYQSSEVPIPSTWGFTIG